MLFSRNSFLFARHIQKMIAATGKKRIGYVFGNIFSMLLSVACICGVKYFFENSFGKGANVNTLVGIFALIILVLLTIYTFLWGFTSQIIMVFISGIGIAKPEERKYNIISFIISLLTTIGLIIGLVILIKLI